MTTKVSTQLLSKTNTSSILVILLIVASFFIGSLYTKVQVLEKGTGAGSPAVVAGNQPTNAGAAAPQAFGSADQVDKLKKEDHVRGDRNARILLIEYSDLECPFCKRFH